MSDHVCAKRDFRTKWLAAGEVAGAQYLLSMMGLEGLLPGWGSRVADWRAVC